MYRSFLERFKYLAVSVQIPKSEHDFVNLFGITHSHVPVLCLPGIEGLLAHTLFPNHIFYRVTRLNLLQHNNALSSVCTFFGMLTPPR